MEDGVDLVAEQEASDEIVVADIAFDELGLAGNGPAKARRQIVENDDLLAGIEQLEHHVAADIASPAGHQNAHEQPSREAAVAIRRVLSEKRLATVASGRSSAHACPRLTLPKD